jgi:Tol biopolymer transport system component
MSCVICRLVGVVILVGALGAAAAPVARADGPRMAFTVLSAKPELFAILSTDAAGADQQIVAGGGRRVRPLPYPFSPPAWSPDGNLIAFSGITDNRTGARPVPKIFVVQPGNGLPVAIAGTEDGADPVFAPDGATIAFARVRIGSTAIAGHSAGRKAGRYRSVSTWTIGVDGGNPRQLTPWHNGLEAFPSSYSPDGGTLAISRRRGRSSETDAAALRLDGSGTTLLARAAADPVFSPDGSTIAFVRDHEHSSRHPAKGAKATAGVETTSDLFTMNADGSGSKRLTDTPGEIETSPSWDPSGQRLAYNQYDAVAVHQEELFFGFGDAIMEVNADGSCRTKVLSIPSQALFGPRWQPGPGRDAGRIDCASG